MFYLQHHHAGPKKLRTTPRGVSISEPGACLARSLLPRPSAHVRIPPTSRRCPYPPPHSGNPHSPASAPLFLSHWILDSCHSVRECRRPTTIRAVSEPSLEPAACPGPPPTVSSFPAPPLRRALSFCVRDISTQARPIRYSYSKILRHYDTALLVQGELCALASTWHFIYRQPTSLALASHTHARENLSSLAPPAAPGRAEALLLVPCSLPPYIDCKGIMAALEHLSSY